MTIAPTEKLKYSHYPKIIVFQAIYHYLRYSLSSRDIEEMMEERGIEVDHSTIHDWVIKYTKLFESNIHKKKRFCRE